MRFKKRSGTPTQIGCCTANTSVLRKMPKVRTLNFSVFQIWIRYCKVLNYITCFFVQPFHIEFAVDRGFSFSFPSSILIIMSRTLLLTSVLAAASIAFAAEVTLPEGCSLPANDGNFSTWKTKFPVCVRADCKYQTAKKNSEQLSDVNDAAPTPKVTEGGLIFEKMLVRSFFFLLSSLTLPLHDLSFLFHRLSRLQSMRRRVFRNRQRKRISLTLFPSPFSLSFLYWQPSPTITITITYLTD